MSVTRRSLALPLTSLALLALIALSGCGGPGQKRALFNGGNLDGFVTVLDSPWVAEGGVLSSKQNPEGRMKGESWLLTEKFYEDFELEFEYRIAEGGNSGVFVRVPVKASERAKLESGGPVPWDNGYEININGTHPEYPTGSVWALAKGPAGLQREGEWNTVRVVVESGRISSWINGQAAVESFVLPPRDLDTSTGSIGFQRHGGPEYTDKLIELRKITIREL